jgi:hypothetical protein
MIIAVGGAAAAGAAAATVGRADRPSPGQHAPARMSVQQPTPAASLRQAYAVFRRSPAARDLVPHASTNSVGRLLASRDDTDVYLLSEPSEKRVCVVALVRSKQYGGTACAPDSSPTSQPPVLMLQHADGPWLLFGAAPDGVVSAELSHHDGAKARLGVASNLFQAQIPAGAPPRIDLIWADGHRMSLDK